MKRGLKLAALGMAAYLLFLIARIPASFVLAQLPPRLTGSLVGVQGTVWSGEAQSTMVEGVDLGRLTWSTNPFALLLGRASTAIEIRGPELTGSAEVSASPGGNIAVRELQATTSPRLIDQFQPLPAELTGDVRVELDSLDYRNEALTAVSGQVVWDKAAIADPYQISLGRYTLALETRDDAIRGSLSEQGSPLRTSGNFMLQPSGQFRLAIRLIPTDSTPQQLRDLLGLLGKTDRSGGVTIRHQGTLAGANRPS